MQLTAEERKNIITAHIQRLQISPPRQSSFRVIAIIYYTLLNDNREYKVIGANDEPCYMNGGICAERAALVQLRFLPVDKITKIVIVTDSKDPIFPGFLCREFMIGQWSSASKDAKRSIDPETMPIITAGSLCLCKDCNLDIASKSKVLSLDVGNDEMIEKLESCSCERAEDGNFYHKWDTVKTTLSKLYPYPSPYVTLTAMEAFTLGCRSLPMRFEESLSQRLSGILLETVSNLIGDAKRMAIERDDRKSLHPIQYAAAVLFANGKIKTATQKKALEYGCSIDAIYQLIPYIENMDSKPILIVQTDQFGIPHPPFASARAVLYEFGHGECHVLVSKYTKDSSNNENFQIDAVQVKDVAPAAPDIGELFSS